MLCRSECEKILQNAQNSAGKGKLLDYHLVRDLSAIGYLGDYYSLTLRYCAVSMIWTLLKWYYLNGLSLDQRFNVIKWKRVTIINDSARLGFLRGYFGHFRKHFLLAL